MPANILGPYLYNKRTRSHGFRPMCGSIIHLAIEGYPVLKTQHLVWNIISIVNRRILISHLYLFSLAYFRLGLHNLYGFYSTWKLVNRMS